MGNEAIIFFDKLGFGWVFDRTALMEARFGSLPDEELSNRSLIKIIENILAEKPFP